jgi:NhaP-type Na+/H+ or K+/H+ antiporter
VDPVYYPFVAGDPLWTGVAAGLALGAFFGWVRSRAIDNIWQRGVIAVLAAVGALLVGFLAALAHGLGGVVGLVVWGAASVALGVVGSQWAMKGSAGSGS